VKTKFIFVAPQIPYGGAERQMLEVKNNFPREVVLIDLTKNISIDDTGSQQKMNISGPGLKRRINRYFCLIQLYKEYRKNKKDIFVFYNSIFLSLGYFLKISGCNVYFSIRENNSDFYTKKAQFFLKKLDGVFTNTPSVFYELKKRNLKAGLFLNTVDTKLPQNDPNTFNQRDPNKIFMVSNVEPHKQVLEVIKGLNKEHYEILIAGTTENNRSYYNLCQQEAKNSNCEVKFLGSIQKEEIINYYKTCGCFLHPSLVEGTSNAIIDAIKYDIPLIVGNTSENRYLVDDLSDFIWEDGSLPKKIENVLKHSKDMQYQDKMEYLRRRLNLKFSARNTHNIINFISS